MAIYHNSRPGNYIATYMFYQRKPEGIILRNASVYKEGNIYKAYIVEDLGRKGNKVGKGQTEEQAVENLRDKISYKPTE